MTRQAEPPPQIQSSIGPSPERQLQSLSELNHAAGYAMPPRTGERNTSQDSTLLQVVHTLARIALAQFLANQTGHHAAHPLLADDSITGIVDGDVVLEVDALVGRGDSGLFGEEGGGLGGRHVD